jgi:P-type Na+/K+ transporter
MRKEEQAQFENHVSGQANKPLSRPAHALPYFTLVAEIKADTEDGLTTSEAKSRLDEYGRNEFGDSAGVQPGKILLRQVANAMTLVMLTTPPKHERMG